MGIASQVRTLLPMGHVGLMFLVRYRTINISHPVCNVLYVIKHVKPVTEEPSLKIALQAKARTDSCYTALHVRAAYFGILGTWYMSKCCRHYSIRNRVATDAEQ